MNDASIRYPTTAFDAATDHRHGRAVDDSFRALEYDNDQVRRWAAEQNRLTRDWIEKRPLADDVQETLGDLLNLPTRGVPAQRRTGLFFTDKLFGTAAPILRRECDGVIEDLVDPEQWTGTSTARISAWNVSPDGDLLAFQISRRGQRPGPLELLDLTTATVREVVPAGIDRPAFAWLTDASGRSSNLLYARNHADEYGPSGLWSLHLPSRQTTHLWQPEPGTEPVFAVPAVAPDGKSILLTIRYGADRRNALLIGWREQAGTTFRWRTVVQPGRAVNTARFRRDGNIVVLTEVDSDCGRLCLFSPEHPDPARWRPLFAAEPEAVIRHFVPVRHGVAVHTVARGVSRVVLVDSTSGNHTDVPLPGDGVVPAMTGGDAAGSALWLGYEALAAPPRVLRVDPESPGVVYTWFESATHIDADVEVRRIDCVSSDGTTIPATVVAKRGIGPGPRPTLLTAYGGFGLTLDRGFSPQLLTWVAAGGVYVLAHVRGGGDLGAGWHAAARGRDKIRSVEDVVAVSEHLVSTGVTTAAQLGLFGVSNGGLLVASAAVLRPELFRACVAVHPVTDLLRFPELGAGIAWKAEYGDPDVPADFAAIEKYSPYHNVRLGVRYPAFMLMAGTSDRRVPAAHSRKLCAALQAASSDATHPRPVLLREEAEVGHGLVPSDLVTGWHTDRLAFLSHCLGLKYPTPREFTTSVAAHRVVGRSNTPNPGSGEEP